MGRPTDDRKEKTVKVRLNTELYEEIASRGENISATIRELIKKGLDSFVPHKNPVKEGFVPQKTTKNDSFVPQKEVNTVNFVPQNFIRKETQEDIERMCHLCGISTELFFDEVDRLFNEGKLEVDCMKLKSNGEYDLSALESVCHLNNVSVDDAIDKIIMSMSRNRR